MAKRRNAAGANKITPESPLPEASTGAQVANVENCIDFVSKIAENADGLLEVHMAQKSGKFKNASGGRTLEELVSSLSQVVKDELWVYLQVYSAQAALDILASDSEENLNDRILQAVVCVCLAGTEELSAASSKVESYRELLRVLTVVDCLLPSLGTDQRCANVISKWCELWYKKNLHKRDDHSLNAVQFLLRKAVSSQCQGTDFKRLYQLKDVLSNLDLGENSSAELVRHLMKCVESPNIATSPDGVKFLTHLFSISPSFVPKIHSCIKKALPGASKATAQVYGRIYLRAWKETQGEVRTMLEECCIQDLMYRGVVARRDLPKHLQVADSVANLLHELHCCKNDRKVQAMLCNLYQPILWRNLKAINHKARVNASQLFFDAFPVEDPELGAEDRAMKQDTQIRIMCNLLKDEYVEVRKVAVKGVCRILAAFWQALTSEEVKDLFVILIKDLCFDASSPQVRASVLSGFRHVLEKCIRSHLYLRQILVQVSSCLFDYKESVRLTYLDLLLAVKKVKLIQFWSVSSLEHLLAQLQVETSPRVCYKIVDLLLQSFFDQGDGDETSKLERCIYLIKENQAASRKFYMFCNRSCRLHDWIKFILAILVTLKRHVKRKLLLETTCTDGSMSEGNLSADEASSSSQGSKISSVLNDTTNTSSNQKRKRKLFRIRQSSEFQMAPSNSVIPAADYQNVSSSESLSSGEESLKQVDQREPDGSSLQEDEKTVDPRLDDLDLVKGLLDVVCIVWMTRSKEIAKSDNAEYRALLEKKASQMLLVLFKYYKTSEVIRPLVYLSSFLPHSSALIMAGFCLSKVRNHRKGCRSIETLDAMGDHVVLRSRLQQKDFDDEWFGCDDALFANDDPLPTYLDALCNWKRGEDLVEILIGWLENDVSRRNKWEPLSGNSVKRVVRFAEVVEPSRVDEALQIIKYVLRHPVNRATLFAKNLPSVQLLLTTLKLYVPMLQGCLANEEAKDLEDGLLVSWMTAFHVVLKISILLMVEEESKNGENVQALLDFIRWIQKNVVSCCHRKSSKEAMLAQGLLNFMVNACATVTLLDLADDRFTLVSLNFVHAVSDALVSSGVWQPTVVANVLKPICRFINSTTEQDICDDARKDILLQTSFNMLRFLSDRHVWERDATRKESLVFIRKSIASTIESFQDELFDHYVASLSKAVKGELFQNDFDLKRCSTDRKVGFVDFVSHIFASKKVLFSRLADSFMAPSTRGAEDLCVLLYSCRLVLGDKPNATYRNQLKNVLATVQSKMDTTGSKERGGDGDSKCDERLRCLSELVDDIKTALRLS